MSIAFPPTASAAAVAPGTGVAHPPAAGPSHGRRAGVAAAPGRALGPVPRPVAAVTGLAALPRTGAAAREVVGHPGVGRLPYAAGTALRDEGAPPAGEEAAPRPAARATASGAEAGPLDPRPAVLPVALLPQPVPTGGHGSPAAYGMHAAVRHRAPAGVRRRSAARLVAPGARSAAA